ncbi:LCP family protein [Actinomadura harenae]|uniref:LytR family transcriptional regulator n=1 Tax=Actinomadura harenae TaxID=2483351 RepID=A0A3M2LT44_9ACTN|nr:LCP family protein [Actinomadura harenae]RMI40659.1 LytR family transcriptional regulator [Actinomadura harenae]
MVFTEPDVRRDTPHREGRAWRVLGWLSVIVSAVLVVTSLTAYGFYWRLQNNIHHEDSDRLIGDNRPKKLNDSLNILLLGTDSRAGANARYGKSMKNDPPRSDTMILLHLSPGGREALGISFPRDLMVPIPSCAKPGGGRTAPVRVGMLNSAFTAAGASCTMKTLENVTDIKIDHFMQVDFTSFKSITDAVGGVEICLPKAVDDRDSKLHLGAGRHLIKGETALAYVRNRHGLGDGSDLGRIKRQQQFMGSLAKKVLSAGTLANPGKLLPLAEAGTKSLTTDRGLDLSSMTKIAEGMRGLTAGKLRFVTVPVAPYAPDPNRVAFRDPDASRFFTAIRDDHQIDTPSAAAATKKPSKLPPAQVRVRVLNATGTTGLAGRVADQLRTAGYQVIGTGTTAASATSQVRYGAGANAQATALTSLLPGATARPGSAPSGTVDLVLGRDFQNLHLPSKAIPKLQGELSAEDDVCKQP